METVMKIVISASGGFDPTPAIRDCLDQADLIIAADGGAAHLHRLGICPQVIIGDLDSITDEIRQFFRHRDVPFLSHPPKKDQTDMELCLAHALEQGASEITFLGATGHRLDHTLANMFLLKRLDDAGVEGRILDAHNEIRLVSRSLSLKGNPGEILSLVPVSDRVTGITLEGFEYPLENATLCMGSARGVSNRFLGGAASIAIASGLALAVRSRD